MGAGEAGGGRRGWWGQARPMGAVSHRPHARACQHQTLGKPPGQIQCQQSTPPILLDHGLQVHPQTRTIMASKCISEFNLISASKCISELLDRGLQMHLQTRSITASKCISEFNLISASKCISKLARLQPPSAAPNSTDHGLQVRTIMASKCISKLARLRPPSASLSSLDHGLQVHL